MLYDYALENGIGFALDLLATVTDYERATNQKSLVGMNNFGLCLEFWIGSYSRLLNAIMPFAL
jgi:hypothetical protein